ncbi:cytochrome c oxidase assembly protein [Meridianimarinicoccus aquatilis]|uniref:Cytochrome c oxidase assembly protein CtaG n=1 Tax=Meridianimarinicoccus aquatilis TaxID=2552766 RepID=A0A4V3BCI5_9RHOB|nr:cytochrome c oxidase assembly protein [Fluviibacterium aquatile]QIE40640.1 cytochrome c oxidase assembly protein [Rhodobacteraceae bacterium SC52]TDL91149.1 cytochrome c oxidase assembly protein [Fluviibacterium aquatile]
MSQANIRKTALSAVGVVVVMASLGFAAVPAYDLFCRVTGFGGTPLTAQTGADTVLEQTVRVRFDASTSKDMAWEFKPVQRTMDIKIGETGLAFYEAYNPTDRVIAGSASYNVTPYAAGGYFTKIDCFCFTMQVLQPGERVQMPVTFFVDPEIVEDDEGKFLHEITLSYTFYETDVPDDRQAELAPAAVGATDPAQTKSSVN